MAITRSGPVTRNTSTVALGLAKILVGSSSDNISERDQILDENEKSLGALNSTNFTSEIEYWRLLSGFPQLEDLTIPLSETAALECEFKELSLRNLAIARGIDADVENYPHSVDAGEGEKDEIELGSIKLPSYVRMEAIYTYPNQTDHMYIIFPRAQVTSSVELNFNETDNANVPITFEAKRADSGVEGGNDAWDSAPLGRIYFGSSETS